MNIDKHLFEIEFLVFSSHKTATQTISKSLSASGARARHCHHLSEFNLDNQFRLYLANFSEINFRQLNVISVFRDPIDRLVSSFFQSASMDIYAWMDERDSGPVHHPEDSLICKLSFAQLEQVFYEYCDVFGSSEAIESICRELSVDIRDFRFSNDHCLGINDLGCCRLLLMRFDLLQENLGPLLHSITGRNISLVRDNVTSEKWYGDQYSIFQQNLKMPKALIDRLYWHRKQLIDLFYPGEFDAILAARTQRYGI